MKEQHSDEIVLCQQISYSEFRTVLFNLGFIQKDIQTANDIATDLWDFLSQGQSNVIAIRAQSLFNFLCYLQSIENIIPINKLNLMRCLYAKEEVVENKYGYSVQGIFYIH